MAQIEGYTQHAVIGDEERELDEHRQQRDGDNESLEDDGPSPVGNNVVVGPLEPEEEGARQDAPPAKVDDATEIGAVVLNVGNRDRIEDGKFFRADVDALLSWSAEAANGRAQEIDVGHVFGTGPQGI